jgi:hypothetical protein
MNTIPDIPLSITEDEGLAEEEARAARANEATSLLDADADATATVRRASEGRLVSTPVDFSDLY